MPGKPLPIIEYPDPRLRQRARAVEAPSAGSRGGFDQELDVLVDDMLATIHATRSVGLSAIQVGVPVRLLVADVSADQSQPVVLANPEIVSAELEGMSEEQCLSVPGFSGIVPRSLRVRVRALDRHGQGCELEAEGLLAVCIQHEVDHLEGKLFIDYLSCLKRARIRRALEQRSGRRPPRPSASAPADSPRLPPTQRERQ